MIENYNVKNVIMFSYKQENSFQGIHKQNAQLKVEPIEAHGYHMLRP